METSSQCIWSIPRRTKTKRKTLIVSFACRVWLYKSKSLKLKTNLKAQNEINSSRSNYTENKEYNDKAIAKYTSFTGVFADGLSMSYSSQSAVPKIKKVILPENSPRHLAEVAAPAAPVVPDKKEEKKGAAPASKKGKKDSTPEPSVNCFISHLILFLLNVTCS